MGKTPKKVNKDGNEQLETNEVPIVGDKQSQSSSRTELTGVQKRSIQTGKKFKSKLRSPTKIDLSKSRGRAIVKLSKLGGNSSVDPVKPVSSGVSNMQPESKESEVKLMIVEKELIKKDADKSEPEKKNQDNNVTKAELTSHEDNNEQNFNVKDNENVEMKPEDVSENCDVKENGVTETKVEENVESKKEDEEDQKTEEKLSKPQEEVVSTNEEENPQFEKEVNSEIQLQFTSESPSTPDPVCQSENETAKTDDISASFISYDATTMLTEPKVKVNDNVQDNTKVEETTESSVQDTSFGRTLRNISGRRSISRLRNVRDRRISPDSSLFVNTSSMSLPGDDCDYKILRHRSGLETYSTNGSSVDRKRKIQNLLDSSTVKKSKTETDNSFLNTSFELLRGLRRPIQVSTPNVETNKLNTAGAAVIDGKVSENQTDSRKRWCPVM